MQTTQKKYLRVTTSKGERVVEKMEIVCCKQFTFGTSIHLKNGDHYLMREDIPQLRMILEGDNFFVVNDKVLINLKFVDAVFPDYLLMRNGEHFNITNQRKQDFFNRVNKYFELDYI